jgi:surface antigen
LVEGISELDRDTGGRSDDPGSVGKALPLYAAGDTFIYSDGRSETVTGIDGDRVQWQSNDGTVITAHRDFVLPAIRRETDLLIAQTTTDVGPAALWPLEAGREVSFSAKTKVTHKALPGRASEFTSQWHCRVEPSQTVSIAAGTFEALRVACRNATPSSPGPVERVWYYAPRIRHYVRREESFESPASVSRVELVAVQLGGKGWPPAARAGLGWALQQALETKTEKQSIEWRSSGVDAEVTITPTTAMNTGDSPYCRTFEQTVRHLRGRRIYPGKACRSASGQWLIPGLESNSQSAKSGS